MSRGTARVNPTMDPLERLVRILEAARGGDDVRASTFVRGLALGALVGAAIAGSTIWQRRRQPSRGSQPAEAASTTER